jgi:aromatic-L-amino-acid decarboxylase
MLAGLTHWQSPNFFAYFPANSSFPAMLGDMLSGALSVMGFLWSGSPAATELETVCPTACCPHACL